MPLSSPKSSQYLFILQIKLYFAEKIACFIPLSIVKMFDMDHAVGYSC